MPAFNLTSCTSGAHLLRPSDLISGTCRQIRSLYVAQSSGATPWIAASVRRYPDIKSYGTLAGSISFHFPPSLCPAAVYNTPMPRLPSHHLMGTDADGMLPSDAHQSVDFQPPRRVYAGPSPIPTQIDSHFDLV